MDRRVALAVAVLLTATLNAACDDDSEGACAPEGLSCDPVSDQCCDPGSHCFLRYTAGTYGTACFGGDPQATVGQSCDAYQTSGAVACDLGLTCLQITGVDGQPVCHQLCYDDGDCFSGDCSGELPGAGQVRACVER